MKRSLKAGLLLASAFLLVACGSKEPEVKNEEVSESTEQVETTESTETTEEEIDPNVDEQADLGKHFLYGGEPNDEGTYFTHSARINESGEFTLSELDYVTSEGVSLRYEDEEFAAKMAKLDEVVVGKKDLTPESLTEELVKAGFKEDDKHVLDLVEGVIANQTAYLIEIGELQYYVEDPNLDTETEQSEDFGEKVALEPDEVDESSESAE